MSRNDMKAIIRRPWADCARHISEQTGFDSGDRFETVAARRVA